MKKPGPYLILLETTGEHPSVFQFESLKDMREWSTSEDQDSPAKFNAKFLGAAFRPSDVTPAVIDSLQGFEDLFAELEELRERQRRANARRRSYNNRPSRRGR